MKRMLMGDTSKGRQEEEEDALSTLPRVDFSSVSIEFDRERGE